MKAVVMSDLHGYLPDVKTIKEDDWIVMKKFRLFKERTFKPLFFKDIRQVNES